MNLPRFFAALARLPERTVIDTDTQAKVSFRVWHVVEHETLTYAMVTPSDKPLDGLVANLGIMEYTSMDGDDFLLEDVDENEVSDALRQKFDTFLTTNHANTFDEDVIEIVPGMALPCIVTDVFRVLYRPNETRKLLLQKIAIVDTLQNRATWIACRQKDGTYVALTEGPLFERANHLKSKRHSVTPKAIAS